MTNVSCQQIFLPDTNNVADKKEKHFPCISLNGANEVIGNRVVTVGLLISAAKSTNPGTNDQHLFKSLIRFVKSQLMMFQKASINPALLFL